MTLQENPPFQLFLWCLIYFWTDKITSIFLTTGGCTAFGILLQVNTSLMLLHPRRRLDPSHLFGSRIITSSFPAHQRNQDDLCVLHGFIRGVFNHIPTRLSYLPKDKVFHPITRQGEEVRLTPRLSFKSTLWRGTDAAQPILQEVLTFCRNKVQKVTIWGFLQHPHIYFGGH